MKYQTQLIRTAAAFILYVLLTATFLPSSAQTIRRVTTAGTGDGSTWAVAMNLEVALAASTTSGDQVWIAQGAYTPHADDRDATFTIPAGVLVYGGFAGTEAALADRTGGATILSGDLMGNDGTRPVRPPATDDQTAYNAALVTYNATRDDNSRTVVTVGGANVTLNGLTIEGGERGTRDIDSPSRSHGAGLFAGVGTMGTTLTACTFNNNNSGYWGGGAYFYGAATLTGCDFNNNSADNDGGGAYFDGAATLTGCDFNNNSADDDGGGGGAGGGAYFDGAATLTGCDFNDNTTNGRFSDGGGAHFDGAATLTGCDFNDNNSDYLGGGAYFRGTATVTNCTFTENTANNDGGGALFLGTTTVTQCTFTENTANGRSSDGGGAYFGGVSTVINSTLYNNKADNIGGGLVTTSAFPFILQNSILIGNTARVAAFGHQIRVFNTDDARIVNIQNNLIAGGADPLGTDPVYSNPGSLNITEANTVDESDATVVFASTDAMNANYLRLRGGSPAVNAGNNLYLNNGTPDDTNDDIKIDAAGNARIQNRRVDLGAYESTLDAPPTQAITFADPTGGVGVRVGQSIDLVATTDALDLFVTFTTDPPGIATLLDDGTGDGMGRLRFDAIGVVTVTAVQAGGDSEGVTYPPATSVTYTITVRPTAGATIFRVAETATGIENGSSWANAMTLQAALGIAIVAGDQIWIAAGTYTPHADDRAGTFTIPAGVLVYGGFDPVADSSDTDASSRSGTATILSGDLSDDDLTDREDANYTLRRTDNSRTVVTIGGANVTLNGLTIEGGERGTAVINSDTSHHGAGLFAGVGTMGTTLTACAFNNNSADDDGGGAYFYGAATLTGCDFNNNSADGDGGGAFFRRTATVTNCTFTENTANGTLSSGGGAYFGGVSTVINSTLYNNNAYIRGGGLYVNNLAFPFILQNSILIGNTALGVAFGHQIRVFNTDNARIVNIQNNLIAGGADPLGTNQGVVYSNPGSPNITEANTVDESDATVVFVSTDAMNANYLRLRVGSPALNAGNNLYLNNGTPVDTNDDIKIDAAGNARIQGDMVDLGAYEGAVAAPMAQAIAFTSDDTGAVGDDITLAATGGASGLDVTFEITTETLPDGSAATTGEVATLGGDGTTLTLTGVGTVDITATQSGNANYTMATQTQTITVSQGTQAIAFTSDDTGAVGDDITLAATGGASGLDVTFEITTETLPDGSAATTGEVATLGDDGTTLTLTGVGTVDITATQSGNANYTMAMQTQTITVSQGTQAIAFTSDDTGAVGDDITLAATGGASGLDVTFEITTETLPDGSAATTGEVATLGDDGTTLTLTGVGTVDITATQSGNANYAAATQTQTITVSQGTQAIAFTSDDTGAVGDDITLAATGGASGLDVTFEITTETLPDGLAATTGEVATLGDDGTTLTLTGVGTVDITATQSGNANYAAATQTQTITVSQGTQAIAFTSDDTGAVGDDITLAATGGASGLDVTFEITTETLPDGSAATTGEVATLGDDGTTLTLTGVGMVDITATQSGNANYAAATQTQTITVSQGTQAIAFTSDDTGAVGDDITLAATGGASGLDVTFEITTETLPDGLAATTGEVATLGDDGTTLTLTGVGMVDITATQSGNANYTMATQTQTITVSQGTQTIEFTPPAGGSVGTDIELMATASSGLDVTFAVTRGGTGTATLGDNGTTLTLTGVGMVDITATQSGNANYTMATQTQTITVSQGKQTIAFMSDDTGAVGDDITLAATGGASGLDVTFEITTETLPDGSAATTGEVATLGDDGTTLTLTGVGMVDITATQSGNANYAAATQTQTITVSQGTQAIAFTSDDTGAVGDDITLAATGGASGLDVMFEITTETLPDGLAATTGEVATLGDDGTTLTLTGVGMVDITATQSGNANYTMATQTQTITVSQGTQAIAFTSDDTGAVGDDITLAATGGASGLDVTFEITTETLPDGLAATTGEVATLGDDGTTLTLTGVGMVDITATQSGNANYTMATQTQTITVSQGTQTIEFTPPAGGSVGTDIELMATASSGLDVTFAVTLGGTGTATLESNGTTLTLTGVGMVDITATQSGNANYTMATQTQTITVSQGKQTIAFMSDDTGAVGDDITLAATGGASGLDVTFEITTETLPDGSAATTGEVATLGDDGTTLTLTGVGMVDITATQSGNANYAAATQTQTITVSQGTQAIAFTSDDTGAVGDDITLAATGGASGLDVTFEITTETLPDGSAATTGEVATLGDDGTTLTLTGVGTVDITATQSGNANYAAATQTQTITVSQGTQAIAFTSDDTGAVGDDITLAATGGASGLDVTFEITTETLPDGLAATTGEVATLGDDGTTLTLTGVGMVDITATQSGNANYTMATQTQTITVSQGTQTIAFKSDDAGDVGTDIELMATASSGLDVTFAVTPGGTGTASLESNGTTLTLTGVGTVDITATQAGNANYTMATQTQTITVSQGKQTIIFTSDTTGNVGTNIELAATASSGLPVTFAITEGDTLATLLDSILSLTGVGTVIITATQAGDANYAEATKTQTITVSQDTQTITFTSDTTGNVGTNIELAATASSGLPVTFAITEGDTLATLVDSTLSLTGVGMVTITATQAGDANYAEATETQTITVSQGTQTITFTSDTTGNVGTNIELAATASSGLPVTFAITEGDTLATLVDSTLSLTGVGTVIITATQAGNENYEAATPVTHEITVSQGTQTITFTSDDVGDVGTEIELEATGGASAQPVTFEITPGGTGTATLSGGTTLTLTGVGMVTITATQVGNANYAAATQTQTIMVSQGTQDITFTSDTTGNVGTNIELAATASSGLPVTFAITEGDTLATLVDSTLSLTGVGTVTITATQEGNANYADTMQTQTIMVSQGTQTITFTSDTTGNVGTNIELAATASSTLPVTFEITTNPATGVATLTDDGTGDGMGSLTLTGAGTITVTASQAGNADYAAATPVERTIIVNAVLGIEEVVDDLVLYPNPTSGKLYFSEQVEEFLLYSSEGRLLDTWKNVRSADLTALPSGLYFVEVIRGGRSVGYRIVRK